MAKILMRLFLLVLISIAPSLTGDLATTLRLCLAGAFASLLLWTGKTYMCSVPGRLEILGITILLFVLGSTAYLQRTDESLGALIGGALALCYVSSIGVCICGALIGLREVRRTRNERNRTEPSNPL
jgi:hypothetical protein